MIDLEQLTVQPQPLGWKEMPLHPAAKLVGVTELPSYPRAAAVHHHFFRCDEITRADFGAMVHRGCYGQRAVGLEIGEPADKVLPVDRKPVPFEAAVERPHLVRR